jgi:hypothetical protein
METEDWVWEDHRLSDNEVGEFPEPYRALAKEFLYGYEGDMDFLLSVQEQVHRLSIRQIRGVINCMRTDGRGRRLLERGPKAPPPVRVEEPAWVHEVCPQVRQRVEHGRHYFPLRSEPGSSKHCLGWHRMTRGFTRTRARFHKPFVRGAKSNLLHRSTHVGQIEWWPEDLHQPGQARPGHWWVGRACTAHAAPLKDPETLTVEEARAALPVVGPGIRHDALVLCPACFPGAAYERVGLTTDSVVEGALDDRF